MGTRPHKLITTFNSFKGLDSRSSDYERSREYASKINNIKITKTGSIRRRDGIKDVVHSEAFGFGLLKYNNVDPLTGIKKVELISIGMKRIYKSVYNSELNFASKLTHDYYAIGNLGHVNANMHNFKRVESDLSKIHKVEVEFPETPFTATEFLNAPSTADASVNTGWIKISTDPTLATGAGLDMANAAHFPIAVRDPRSNALGYWRDAGYLQDNTEVIGWYVDGGAWKLELNKTVAVEQVPDSAYTQLELAFKKAESSPPRGFIRNTWKANASTPADWYFHVLIKKVDDETLDVASSTGNPQNTYATKFTDFSYTARSRSGEIGGDTATDDRYSGNIINDRIVLKIQDDNDKTIAESYSMLKVDTESGIDNIANTTGQILRFGSPSSHTGTYVPPDMFDTTAQTFYIGSENATGNYGGSGYSYISHIRIDSTSRGDGGNFNMFNAFRTDSVYSCSIGSVGQYSDSDACVAAGGTWYTHDPAEITGQTGYVRKGGRFKCDENVAGHWNEELCNAGAADHSDGQTGHWKSEFDGTDADDKIYYEFTIHSHNNEFFTRWDVTKYAQSGNYNTWVLTQPTGHLVFRGRPTLNGITVGEQGSPTFLDLTGSFTDDSLADGIGYIASRPSLFINGEELTRETCHLRCEKHDEKSIHGHWEPSMGIFANAPLQFLGLPHSNPHTGGVRNLQFIKKVMTSTDALAVHNSFIAQDHETLVGDTGYNSTNSDFEVIDLIPGKAVAPQINVAVYFKYRKSSESDHISKFSLVVCDQHGTLGAYTDLNNLGTNTYVTWDVALTGDTGTGTIFSSSDVSQAKITNVSTINGVTTLTIDKELKDTANYVRELKIYNHDDYGKSDVVAVNDNQSEIIAHTDTNVLYDRTGNGNHCTLIDGDNRVSYINNAITTSDIPAKPYLNGDQDIEYGWDRDTHYTQLNTDVIRDNVNNPKAQNPDMINLKNCVYISNCDSRGLLKYDGNSLYLAALKSSWDGLITDDDYVEPTVPTSSDVNTDTVSAGAGVTRFQSDTEVTTAGLTDLIVSKSSTVIYHDILSQTYDYVYTGLGYEPASIDIDVEFVAEPFELSQSYCSTNFISLSGTCELLFKGIDNGAFSALPPEIVWENQSISLDYYGQYGGSTADGYTEDNYYTWFKVASLVIKDKTQKTGTLSIQSAAKEIRHHAQNSWGWVLFFSSCTLSSGTLTLNFSGRDDTAASTEVKTAVTQLPIGNKEKYRIGDYITFKDINTGTASSRYISSIDDSNGLATLNSSVEPYKGYSITVKGPASFRYLWRKAHVDHKNNVHYANPSPQHLDDTKIGKYRLDFPYNYDGVTEVTDVEVPIPWAYEGDERGSLIIGGSTNIIYTYEDANIDDKDFYEHLDDPTTDPGGGVAACTITCQIKIGDNIFLYNDDAKGYCDEGVAGHTTKALCDAGTADHTDTATGHWVAGSQEFEVTDKDGPFTITTPSYPANSRYYKVTLKPKEGEPDYVKIPSGGIYLYDGTAPNLRTFATLTGTDIGNNNCKDYKIWASASNHRMLLYRTKNIWFPDVNQYIADPTYYLVDEIALPSNNFQTVFSPHNSSGPTNKMTSAIYQDKFHDNALAASEPFIVPDKTPGTPPKCKYMAVYNSQLILAGDPEAVDVVYYSDYDAPENFPVGTNSFTVDSEITGLATLGRSLYVFQRDTIQVMQGDLILDSFRVSTLSKGMEIGAISHNSIVEVNNTLFFLTKNGIFSVQNSSSSIIEVSALIEPEFDKEEYDFERSTAFNWTSEDLYLVYLPKITKSSFQSTSKISAKACESSSGIILAYDYKRGTWTSWSGMLAGGGFANIENDIYLSARRDVDDHYGVLSRIIPKLDWDELYSSAGKTSLSYEYTSNWEALGDHTTPKKFLRLKTLLDDTDNDSGAFSTSVKVAKNLSTSEVTTSRNMSGSHDILKLPSGKSKQLRISFTGTAGFNIKGYELEIAQPIKTGEMKE